MLLILFNAFSCSHVQLFRKQVSFHSKKFFHSREGSFIASWGENVIFIALWFLFVHA